MGRLLLSKTREITELAFMYTQIYIAPLLLLACLTAMTIYRREMSSNRVYLRNEGQGEGDTEPEPAKKPSDIRVGRNHYWASSSITAILKSYIVSLAPLLWCQSVAASHPTTTRPDTATTTSVTSNTQPQQSLFSELIGVVVPDLLSFTWTDDSTAALKTAAASVVQFARLNIFEDSWILSPRRGAEEANLQHPDELPPDVQVHVLSFLHPKDVVTFAGTSKACRDIVQGDGPVTVALWKSLFERDYSWAIHSWEVGRKAFLRSNVLEVPFGKEFYFRFGLGYLNYLLAGLNTQEKCLIGLHGNIYDITDFITSHPGSPDTLLVHAGRDASRFFDDMDHSKGARNLAKDLCVVVDTSYRTGSYGLRPTSNFNADGPTPDTIEADPVCSKTEWRTTRRGTLESVYKDFIREESRHRRAFKNHLRHNKKVLHSNVFYDPFRQKWSGWYTSTTFETVFLPNQGWDFSKSQSFDVPPATGQEEEGENQLRAFC